VDCVFALASLAVAELLSCFAQQFRAVTAINSPSQALLQQQQ
jgi:hypothetical protein